MVLGGPGYIFLNRERGAIENYHIKPGARRFTGFFDRMGVAGNATWMSADRH